MRRPGLGAALLMAVLMASTSGCMGLIAARESVESLREPAYESLNNEKVSIIHQFTGLANYSYEYTNREAFMVNDQTTEISIYFKATFELSRNLPPSFWDNESRYVRATLTDGDGMVQWEQDVSEDANPLEETLQPNPSFAQGEWELDVKARGGGDNTLVSVNDNFVIIVTVINTCTQYPLVEDCN
ncbi:MAG: hypothetical protein VW982_05815 [Candidatus Poseidoniales archaeon]